MIIIGILFLFLLRMGGLVNNSIIANIRTTEKEIQTVFSRKKSPIKYIFYYYVLYWKYNDAWVIREGVKDPYRWSAFATLIFLPQRSIRLIIRTLGAKHFFYRLLAIFFMNKNYNQFYFYDSLLGWNKVLDWLFKIINNQYKFLQHVYVDFFLCSQPIECNGNFNLFRYLSFIDVIIHSTTKKYIQISTPTGFHLLAGQCVHMCRVWLYTVYLYIFINCTKFCCKSRDSYTIPSYKI